MPSRGRIVAAAPVFLVADVAASLRWYESALQFSGAGFPEAPPHRFGIVRRDDAELMLQQLAGYAKPDLYRARPGGVWHAYLRVDDVRELHAAVQQRAPASVLEPLRLQPYGELEFAVRDLDGYVLVFAESALG